MKTKKGVFSEKEYKKQQKVENTLLLKKQKILKKKYKESEKRRKIVNKIKKEELKKISPKTKKKKISIRKLTLPRVQKLLRRPTIEELDNHLLKLSDSYDIGIKKSRKLHRNLTFLGLTDSGLKEIKNEKIKQRKKRIRSINKTHRELIKVLEKNKHIEQEIEKLHSIIKKQRNSKRK